MATYEKVTCETGRFDVVDADDHLNTVTEYTTYYLRISITKRYRPMVGAVAYLLDDGTAVQRSCGGHFDAEGGMHRFFVTHESHSEPSAGMH